MAKLIPILQKEMEQEANTTRKMLGRIPDDKYDWQPHEKSMKIKNLAVHIAELPSWVNMVLDTNELDFASSPYKPADINNTAQLMDFFETTMATAKERLGKADEEDLAKEWTLRNGDQILSTSNKYDVLRMVMNQVTHHRAQMGVNLRMLNVPIPGSYGPSADEQGF